MQFGFIGAGNMAYAMMQAIQGKQEFVYTDINTARLKELETQLGVAYAEDNKACAKQADIIVLAIKPQFYEVVLNQLQKVDLSGKILLAIAPGIAIETILKWVGQSVKVVRAMPNTPAMVKMGMTGVCLSEDDFNHVEKETLENFFESFGKMVYVTEQQLDMMVPVAGSAPAYVYMMIEAMADAGVAFGLPRAMAIEMAAQTVMGSAQMVLESKSHPAVLKDAVCSPGGTTIEAVKTLEAKGFRHSLIAAMTDCYEKTLSFKQK